MLAAILLTGACDFQRDPLPFAPSGEEITVHSVLEAGARTVVVLLTRVDPRVPAQARPASPLSGAEVLLVAGSDTIRLEEAPTGFQHCFSRDPLNTAAEPAGPGCYGATVPGGVRAGERYRLLITLPQGGTVHGETVIPDPLPVLQPQAGARFVLQRQQYDFHPVTIPVRWGSAAGAAGVSLGIRQAAVFSDGEQVAGGACAISAEFGAPPRPIEQSDTASLRVHRATCYKWSDAGARPIEWDSLRARLVVIAFDTAYVRYSSLLRTTSVDRRRAAAGVTGALGVFAGSALTEREVMLLPDAP